MRASGESWLLDLGRVTLAHVASVCEEGLYSLQHRSRPGGSAIIATG